MNATHERWVALCALLVPYEIRGYVLGDVLAERRERREEGESRLAIELASLRELAEGAAQRVPLREEAASPARQPPAVETATLLGWPLWRVAGPALFCGHATGSGALFWGGVACLVGAFAALVFVALRGREPFGHAQVRLMNGVLSGAILVLLLVLCFAAGSALLLALAALLSSPGLAAFAAGALAWLAAAAAGAVTLWGWVPEVWTPRRGLARI